MKTFITIYLKVKKDLYKKVKQYKLDNDIYIWQIYDEAIRYYFKHFPTRSRHYLKKATTKRNHFLNRE